MMHKASSYLGVVPYRFSRSSVKFQGHMAKKIVDLEPNWVFFSRLNVVAVDGQMSLIFVSE